MADIFISYAHEDRGRIERLAAALQAAGFDVWWDREAEKGLRPGDDFDLFIEAQLEAAACVVVSWSAASRQSTYVRDEAREGMQQEKLVPVFLEPVKPPLGFRSLHTEDFTGWQGETETENWQRLVLQAQALKDAASAGTAPPPRLPGDAQQPAPRPPATFNTGAAFAATTTPVIGAAWLLSSGPQFGVMGLTVTLALMAFWLFRQADQDLHPHMRALATRWLMPIEGRAGVNTPQAFLRLFEAVFGERHWSWKCLWRSVVASTIGLFLMFAVIDYFVSDASFFTQGALWPVLLLLAVMFGFIPNMIGDYISLWETRKLMQIAARRPRLLPLLIVVDAVLTLVIASLGMLFLVKIVPMTGIGGVAESLVAFVLKKSLELFHMTGSEITVPETSLGLTLGYGIYATSFITSVWLWLTLLFTPLSRALLWSRSKGLTALGRLFDVERKPFTAFGYLMAMLILMAGSLFWAAGFFIR